MRKEHGVKKIFGKKFIVILAMALLLTVSVGSTVAYIFTGTDAVVNKLVPPKKAALIELNMKALTMGKEYKG